MASENPPEPVRVFSIVGDSNIRNLLTKTITRANPQLQSSQIIPCGHVGIFIESLGSVRAESSVCVLSCVTNFITGADGPATVSSRVEPVLQDVRSALVDACLANPERYYLLSPPMYRSRPTWYRDSLPEILTMFSQVFSIERPANLHLLSSFPTPEFEQDGVHLTAFSGLEFIMHLFDASHDLLNLLETTTDEVVIRSCESTRVLEDRVMVLEQDHRRLNRAFESKTAADAELADFHLNEGYEDSFVITGLAKIPDDLIGKAWQERALRDVQEVLKILMGRECPIVFVKNSTSRTRNAEISYNVQMPSVQESSLIRKKFGSFFLGNQDRRPENLLHVNIKNLVTPETRTRVSVLKLLAKRYRDSNQGSHVKVIHYDPRPLIKITPAASASDRRIKTYNYVEAVQTLPCNFTSDEVAPIIRRLNPKLLGKVRALFVVLSDDAFQAQLRKFDRKSASSQGGQGPSGHQQQGQPEQMDQNDPSPDINPATGPTPAPVAAPGGSGVAPGSGFRHSSGRYGSRNPKRVAGALSGNSAKK